MTSWTCLTSSSPEFASTGSSTETRGSTWSQASTSSQSLGIGATASARGRLRAAAGPRRRRSVTMIAVTKTYPVTDVATLVELGVLDVGESRDHGGRRQGRSARFAVRRRCDAGGVTPRWHFVGRVQTNKCGEHRTVCAQRPLRPRPTRGRSPHSPKPSPPTRDRSPLEAFAQVSLDGDRGREAVPSETTSCAGAGKTPSRPLDEPCCLRGVMAVAPLGSRSSTLPSPGYAEVSAAGTRRTPLRRRDLQWE